MDDIKTNMGDIPMGDYLDIVAQQNGFEDYSDMVSYGLNIWFDDFYIEVE